MTKTTRQPGRSCLVMLTIGIAALIHAGCGEEAPTSSEQLADLNETPATMAFDDDVDQLESSDASMGSAQVRPVLESQSQSAAPEPFDESAARNPGLRDNESNTAAGQKAEPSFEQSRIRNREKSLEDKQTLDRPLSRRMSGDSSSKESAPAEREAKNTSPGQFAPAPTNTPETGASADRQKRIAGRSL